MFKLFAKTPKTIARPFSRFMKSGTFSGILLIGVTAVAIIWANSSAGHTYFDFWETELGFEFGTFHVSKSLSHWINDGLMGIFFFVIGLEIKREILEGELSNPRKAALPVFAALGGMVFPALIFFAVNSNTGFSKGWGIPTATDIAFSLGVLALLGSRVPLGIKVFLTALAIVDDLGAVVSIALFYSSDISALYLLITLLSFVIMMIMNKMGVRNTSAYAFMGILGMWVPLMASGVHATIAGVLAAIAIPARQKLNSDDFRGHITYTMEYFDLLKKKENSNMITAEQREIVESMRSVCTLYETPLQKLEHDLQPIAIYVIMPIFALANTGVILDRDIFNQLFHHPLSQGIILGLVLGKFVGITFASWLAVKLKLAILPEGVCWRQIAGAAVLGGIGFTMSLFITDLAYSDPEQIAIAKKSIFAGSLLAGVLGYIVLTAVLPAKSAHTMPEGDSGGH